MKFEILSIITSMFKKFIQNKKFFSISKLKIIFLTGTNGKTSIGYGSHFYFLLMEYLVVI